MIPLADRALYREAFVGPYRTQFRYAIDKILPTGMAAPSGECLWTFLRVNGIRKLFRRDR